MPLDRTVLDAHLARLNAQRPPGLAARLEAHTPDRFTLSFPNRPMAEGQCIDQDFSDIQWGLLDEAKVTTGIVAARHDEAEDRYHVEYEVVEWE